MFVPFFVYIYMYTMLYQRDNLSLAKFYGMQCSTIKFIVILLNKLFLSNCVKIKKIENKIPFQNSNRSQRCSLGMQSSKFAGWSILVMPCCWRTSVIVLVLLGTVYHARRFLRKPHWLQPAPTMTGMGRGVMASVLLPLGTWCPLGWIGLQVIYGW